MLYRSFIFCFHYDLYPGAASRFLSEVSATALATLKTLAFVLRFDKSNFDVCREIWEAWKLGRECKLWEENCEILSRGFTGLRAFFFEIQALGGAVGDPLSLRAKHEITAKLLKAAEPLPIRPEIKVRWVGVGIGKDLADLCQKELTNGRDYS